MEDIYISNRLKEIQFEDLYSNSNNQPPINNTPEPNNKKKKRKFIKKLFVSLLSIFLILSLIISAFAFVTDYSKVKLKRNEYVNSVNLKNSPMVTNILLIGADGESGESSRSDSMILVSIDFVHQKIKMTSFLRDSWVYVPCKDDYHKLNSAYAYNGPQGIVDTLEYNFGVDIDHFIKVDFEMFTRLIDNFGGIDIEVSEKEASFITKTTRYTLQSGESVHLDGAKALIYCRIRKLDSDYMRTYRQRKVISALIHKISHTNPSEIINIFQDVLPLLETDLNPLEITSLIYKGGIAAIAFDIQQIRIPTDDLFTTGYRGSNWVEIIDIDGCKNKLIEFIYTNYKEEE